MTVHNERAIVCKVIEAGSIKALIERNITPDWFTQEVERRAMKFIFDWNRDYGQPPSPRVMAQSFPGFKMVKVDDPIEGLCDLMVAYRRRTITVTAVRDAAELVEKVGHDEAIQSLQKSLAELERSNGVVTNDMDLTEDADQRFSWYEQVKNRPSGLLGYPTGFPTIDKATAGLQPGQLVALVASAKVGKSITSLQIATNIHQHPNQPSVMYQSFEMSNFEQQTRHDAMRAHISLANLRRGQLSATEELAYKKMLQEMDEMPNPMVLTDAKNGVTVAALSAKIDDLGRPDLIVVDGVYLMIDELTGESRTPQSLSNITTALKRLAQRIERPILMTTQALEWKMKKTRLNSQSVGYSSSIVQDADVVLGLERIEDLDEARTLRVLLSRNCPPTEALLRWDFEHGRFEEESE